jgi:hypothetical protein
MLNVHKLVLVLLGGLCALAIYTGCSLNSLHNQSNHEKDILCQMVTSDYTGADGGGGYAYQAQQLCGTP